jgi:hypothetical protein
MRLQTIKLTVLGICTLFAAGAFLFSARPMKAGSDDILELIADYKTWKQVNKPTPGLALTGIELSSLGGG